MKTQTNRRQFLTLTLALTGAGALTLTGCGGGGADNSNSALSLSVIKGRLVLPSNFTLKISEVVNLFGAATPETDATFNFVHAAETPLLTCAYGPGGGAVLYGFLSSTNTELSANSTARALAYFVLGVGVYSQEIQTLYQTAIAASSSLKALEASVASALLARGEAWLDWNDPVLVAALSAIQNELSARALATRGVILDKTDRVSGLQVNADGIGKMTITNFYRRRSYVYVDRVSYKVKGTGESVDSKGPVLPQPTKILPVKGITNGLASLGLLFGGQRDFYEPVVYGPMNVPVYPADAASTTYTATAVGLGVSPGDFGKLTQIQNDGWWEVSSTAILVDLVAPVIAGIVIPSFSKDIDKFTGFVYASAAFKDLVNVIAANKDIRSKAESGNIAEAGWDALVLFAKTDILKNSFIRIMTDFLDSAVDTSIGSNNPLLRLTDRADFLDKTAGVITRYISRINVGLQAFDTVVTGFQLKYCNSADVFMLEVTNGIAKLNPDHATAIPSENPIAFTATVTDADVQPGTVLSYQWSCECKFGDISDGLHTNRKDGRMFDSSSKVLSYVPTGKATEGDTEAIIVKIFNGPINKRIPIGSATSLVTFNAVALTPKSAIANPKTLTPVRFTVTLSGAYDYEFTTTGAQGTLVSATGATGSSLRSDQAYVGYLARGNALDGATDEVSVKVFNRDASPRLIGSAKATVTIGATNTAPTPALPGNPYQPPSSK